MANFYFISPVGRTSPDLYPSLVETFEKAGHCIVGDVKDAGVVFFDLYSGVGVYNEDELLYVLDKRLPVSVFDETDYGGMSKEVFFLLEGGLSGCEWHRFIRNAQDKCNFVYFMRKLDKTKNYPEWIYPYEKCLYKDCDFPLTTQDELFSRPYDFCFIGNESPQRKNVVKGLLDAGLNGYVHWTNDKGKLPHREWLHLHKQAKLFLSADGGGFTDERVQQLITEASMLKQKNNHLQIAPFTDCVNCLMVSENPTEEETSGIKQVLKDSGYLYEIYRLGAEHANKYYTEEWRALYILKILKENKII